MSYLFLIPVSITLGLIGLGAFFWSMRNNQYDDLDGAAARVLIAESGPLAEPTKEKTHGQLAADADHPDADRRV